MTDFDIEVTPKATQKALEFIAQEASIDGISVNDYMLRLSIEGGGCSGLRYNLFLEKVKNENDIALKKGDLSVVVDHVSQMYLNGVKLDYFEGMQGGFKITNPNESGSCGCGHSFNI